MKISCILLVLMGCYFQPIFACQDSLPPRNSFSLDLAYQYYFHKGNYSAVDGNKYPNTNSYAPSIAQNKSGFSFGLAYERRFLKKRGLFLRTSLGFGRLNYGLGYRYELSKFWDIPALQGLVIDTIYQLEYPYLYADFRVGYKFPIGKKMELGFWAGIKINQLIAKYDIQQMVSLYVPHNGRMHLFNTVLSTQMLQLSYDRFNIFQTGANISIYLFNRKINIGVSYQNSIWYDKQVGLANFTYRRVKTYNEATGYVELEISGKDIFLYRIRALELSLSVDF